MTEHTPSISQVQVKRRWANHSHQELCAAVYINDNKQKINVMTQKQCIDFLAKKKMSPPTASMAAITQLVYSSDGNLHQHILDAITPKPRKRRKTSSPAREDPEEEHIDGEPIPPSRPPMQNSEMFQILFDALMNQREAKTPQQPTALEGDTQYKMLAMKHRLTTKTIYKIHKNQYVSIIDLTPNESAAQDTGALHYEHDGRVIATRQSRRKIPQEYAQWHRPIETWKKILKELGSTKPTTHIDLYSAWARDFLFKYLTALGANAADKVIRSYAAEENIDVWPIPTVAWPALIPIFIVHLKPNPAACNICGQLTHLAEDCADREHIKATRNDTPKGTGNGNQVICRNFSTIKGCTFIGKCRFRHLCSFCKGKGNHKSDCKRT